jgi:hypothetical protein
MSGENLLEAYQVSPSFALWDGEYAVLRFTGNLDRDYKKLDSKGNEQTYLAIECMLIKHSNENYSHRHNTVCFLRTGKESTLAKWALDERGGLKANDPRNIFRVDNSAKLGFSLRLEDVDRS